MTARPNAKARAARRRYWSVAACPIAVVCGPPCAGKSTFVADQAGAADVVIDLDALALAVSPPATTHHAYPDYVRTVAIAARRAAVDRASTDSRIPKLWIIHAHPDPHTISQYLRWDARFVVIDPGEDVVSERCATERPPLAMAEVHRWYNTPPVLPPLFTIVAVGDGAHF